MNNVLPSFPKKAYNRALGRKLTSFEIWRNYLNKFSKISGINTREGHKPRHTRGGHERRHTVGGHRGCNRFDGRQWRAESDANPKIV